MSQKKQGLAGFAVRNPHFVVVASIVVVILGSLAIVRLPKDLLPSANLPAVQILSFYSGMPVEHVEKNLTARFERYTGQAIGIERQESRSMVGVSIVKNFFGPGTDLNTAIAQTTSLVMSVLRRLPPGTQPPLILPFDPMAAVPLALVAVSGDRSEKDLYDTARYDVRNAIQSVNGAMAPTVMGGSERQVVIFLDKTKLKRFNFSPLDVMERLNRLNTFVPSGNVKIGAYDYQIESNGLVENISDMNDFPLRSENGVPIYLRDLGQAKDAAKIQTNIVTVDGKRQVYVPVYRQPGANSIQVVDEIKATLGKLEAGLKGTALKLVADQSTFIRHAIDSITEEALIGGGLAAFMVFLFLGSPRATGGIMISLPLALLVSFLGLLASGQTINAMTLGGLALSIGVLVDNSIVVLENIMRKIQEGMSPREASVVGANEVAMPVLAATLATIIVFFPVLFLQGIVKTLFSALAKSVVFAMIGSYFAAVIVMPLFTSRVLKAPEPGKTPPPTYFQRLMQRLTDRYARLLGRALQHRKGLLVGITVALLALSTFAVRLGTELFPRADAGNLVVSLRQKSGTRIEETAKFAAEVEAKLRQWIPREDLAMVIANAGVYYGFPAAFTPNAGPQDVFFHLELTEDRKHTSQYYARQLREKLPAAFPGVELGIETGGLLASALNGGLHAPIDVQVQGPDLLKAHGVAEELSRRIARVPGAVDVRVQQRVDSPQLLLDVNRRLSGQLGLTTDSVVKNIVSSVSGSATFNPSIWVDPKSGIDYLLGVQMPEERITSTDDLLDIPITGGHSERSVPLRDVASLRKAIGPSEISHLNLRAVQDIYLDAQDRDIGGLSRDVEAVVAHYEMPPGYSAAIRGEVSEMKRSVGSLGGGFLLAAVLVYLLLVVQFRSFQLPAIIMATVPMGMVGIVLMLVLTNTYFSIQAAIGAIFMIGIAVANGVLLVEFMLHQSEDNADLDGAVLEGARARLRPILMTSLSSMLGLVPMAIGLGKGAEANIPLGRAVIGGQLLSTALTLFVVPMLFRLLHKPEAVRKLEANERERTNHGAAQQEGRTA